MTTKTKAEWIDEVVEQATPAHSKSEYKRRVTLGDRSVLPPVQAVSSEQSQLRRTPDWVGSVVRAVAELDDRNSPEDWPEAMLVTADELRTILESFAVTQERLQQMCSDWGAYWRSEDAHGVTLSLSQAHALLMDALGVEVEIRHAAPQPAQPQDQVSLTSCNCRWNGETQVQQCTLHAAHIDAIHEWAERAKMAEAKLAAPPGSCTTCKHSRGGHCVIGRSNCDEYYKNWEPR